MAKGNEYVIPPYHITSHVQITGKKINEGDRQALKPRRSWDHVKIIKTT